MPVQSIVTDTDSSSVVTERGRPADHRLTNAQLEALRLENKHLKEQVRKTSYRRPWYLSFLLFFTLPGGVAVLFDGPPKPEEDDGKSP